MFNLIAILRKLMTPENRSKLGLGAIVVIVAIVVWVQHNQIEKLKNDLASAHPDTVYVTKNNIQRVEFTDTIKVMGHGSIVTTKVVRDTVYVTKESFDTVAVTKSGLLRFRDDSNKLVSIAGQIDYPYGNGLQLIYTEKKFYDLQKQWGVFLNAGMLKKDPMIGGTFYVKHLELGIGVGKDLWYGRIGIRVW